MPGALLEEMLTDPTKPTVAQVGVAYGPRSSVWMGMMNSVPNMSTSVGFMGLRGSNTILRGGWADNPRRSLRHPLTRRLPSKDYRNRRSTFRARSFRSLPNQSMFDDAQVPSRFRKGKMRDKYSPFQASDIVNQIAEKTGLSKKGEKVLTKGMYSRVSAAARVARTGTVDAGTMANVGKFVGHHGPGPLFADGSTSGKHVSQALLASGKGRLSQTVGGYMSGLRSGVEMNMTDAGVTKYGVRQVGTGYKMVGSPSLAITPEPVWQGVPIQRSSQAAIHPELRATSERTGEGVFARYADKAAIRLAEAGLDGAGKIGMKAAGEAVTRTLAKEGAMEAAKLGGSLGLRAAGMAVPGLNVAMAAWMAYDMAKLGGTLIGAGVRGAAHLAIDGTRSLIGNISNAPMSNPSGLRSANTEAALTSRQRGVAAIANSRLNARSILGNEASQMAAHFG